MASLGKGGGVEREGLGMALPAELRGWKGVRTILAQAAKSATAKLLGFARKSANWNKRSSAFAKNWQPCGASRIGRRRPFGAANSRSARKTRAVPERNVHPKRAAVAFDVTPETMMKYYTATEKKQTADEVLGELADDLLPKKGRSL
jgi:hypothetical protein